MPKKLLIIVGPTATGKTKLGIKLAKKFGGEIISCDSRQVYRGMDIVTGKDFPVKIKYQISKTKNKIYGFYSFDNVSVWGLDIVRPDEEFSAAHWVQYATTVINNVWKRKKLPIIVGGTGFWIKALTDSVDTIGIPPDPILRQKLSGKSNAALLQLLTKMDQKKAENMNISDRCNPRRLIRAIEIAAINHKIKIMNKKPTPLTVKKHHILKIGLTGNTELLGNKIKNRIKNRIQKGAVKEAEKMLKGYSPALPSMTACGYRVLPDYFTGKQSLQETINKWFNGEKAYLKRQLVWFKKDKKIKWFDIGQSGWENKVVLAVKSWYDIKNGPES